MSAHRLFYVLIVALLLLTGCAPRVEATSPAPRLTPTPMVASTPIPPTLTPTSTPIPTSTPTPWNLVAIGDSIPFNSEEDCPGCTGFVDRYAEAISAGTGRPVKFQNLTKHTGLQIDGLLKMLENNAGLRDALANADIIIVGIAHNDAAMNSNEDPCDGPNDDNPDWSKYNESCAAAAAEMFRPKFESVYAQVVALRAGKPTIFRTINRYNDWIGWPGHDLPPEGIDGTRLVIDAWNEMICKAAEENGFICADIHHAFNGPDGLKPSGDLVASDYTHPSDKGNEVIAQVLIDLGFAPIAP